MPLIQFARGLWAKFSPTENPFGPANGMDDNLRMIDDHLGLYTVLAPIAPGTPFPANPADGDGQIYTNGTYATFNAGTWRVYPTRVGIKAVLLYGAQSWVNVGDAWEQFSSIDESTAEGISHVLAVKNAAISDIEANLALVDEAAAAYVGQAGIAPYRASLWQFIGEGAGMSYAPVTVTLDNRVSYAVALAIADGDLISLAVYRAALWQFIGEGSYGPARVTLDNRVLTYMDDLPETVSHAYVDSTSLRIIGGQLGDALVNADAGKTWLSAVAVQERIRAVYKDATDTRRMVAVGPTTGNLYGDGATLLRLDVGQSNGRGSQSGASVIELVRTDYPYPTKLLMPAHAGHNIWCGLPQSDALTYSLDPASITGLEPLQGAIFGANGTTSVESAALRYFERCAEECGGYVPTMVVGNIAIGGQTIQNLSQDPPDPTYTAWVSAVTVLNRLHEIRPAGRQFLLDWLYMMQGESNTAESALGALHDQYRADIAAQAAAIFGQTAPVRMISWQPASYSTSTGARSLLTYYLANRSAYGTFWCGGPAYCFPFADAYLHHSALGHDMRGEFNDEITRRVERTGYFDPLHMLSASVTGASQITVTLSAPAVIDLADDVVAVIANAGITLAGGAVTGVTVTGTSLVIATSGAASSVTAVRAAMTGQVDPRTADNIPRTNIRMASALGTYRSGKGMYGWLCAQEISIS